MPMKQRIAQYTLNCYDCDFCASCQAVYQPNDMDSYTKPKGWEVEIVPGQDGHARIKKVRCKSCVDGTPHIIEGELAEGVRHWVGESVS